MDFSNATHLDDWRLLNLLCRHTAPYRHDDLTVRVRYSRSSDFSGSCYYRDNRIYVNVGFHNDYPYTFGTHIAKARSNRSVWWRETYRLTVADPYQLVLFVYLHELYHYLVKAAGRSVRRKEAMCDRFATRVLVDQYHCTLRDRADRAVPRDTWDFRDLHAFVAAAPREGVFAVGAVRAAIPVRIRGARGGTDGLPAGLGNTAASG
jgi:hypothetical protein